MTAAAGGRTHPRPGATRPDTRRTDRVAVTGLAISCALGEDTDRVWKSVREGSCGIGLTRRLDVSTLSCRYSGEIPYVPAPTRRPRGRLDRAMSLALNAASEAVDAAGLPFGALDPYRAGVALGTSVGGLDEGERFHWELLHHGVEATRKQHLLVYPLYTSADAVSIAFGLKGPKVVISNACAAGANAIGWAYDVIRDGRADAMLAGGVDVLDILSLAGFDSLKALDELPCAPYTRSSGLNLGEGVALLVLESEGHARQRGADVLGYVLGYALTSDAYHATAPDSGGSGARRAMSRALDHAGLAPGDVDYINGHGTGTPANDSAEMKAVGTLFDGLDVPPVSSTKSQVGHMLGAAGAIEAAVCALALRDQTLPPTVNAAEPVARDIVPNRAREQELDVVVSNSFAFGGNNCALVLGRTPRSPAPAPAHRTVITGAGVVSPLGSTRRDFLEGLRAGRQAIGEVTQFDAHGCRSRLAAEIGDTSYRRLINPAYARRLDQLGTLTLAASRMALQDAGLRLTRAMSERIGMVFGTFTGPLETVAALSETIGTAGPHKVNPRLFPNSVMNAAAGHACLSLQMKGPLSTVATGLAAGLTSLGYAADLVARGEADAVLAVSADELSPLLHLGYDRLGVLTDSALRPYDRNRSGSVLGSGGTALVVESLEHALARDAEILGEVLGYAITSDGFRVSGNDPSGEAWAACFRRAVEDARVDPGDIGVVYGDARGTQAVDAAEAGAIADVWQPGSVRVTSLAGQIGHIHATTPMLSAVAALESTATGWVPPIRGCTDPLPEVAGFLGDTPDPTGRPALVTAANWGGTYASVVLAPFVRG